jgi:uncharacterized protein YegL
MRRLPLFFLLDVSESMAGKKLARMQEGMRDLLRHLRQDPQALETAFVSFIAFAGIAKVLYPLHEVFAAMAPSLPMGSGTALGAALHLLMDEIDRSVRRNTPEAKGDYKPIIYLFTDGRPTDDTTEAIARWTSNYSVRNEIIAIALGDNVDLTVLKRLTKRTFVFNESKPEDFRKFIQWISQSIALQSQRLDSQGDAVLAPLDHEILTPAAAETATATATANATAAGAAAETVVADPPHKRDTGSVDESCVTLVSRCQKNHKPFLVKYEPNPDGGDLYVASGSFQLEESYFEWSAGQEDGVRVSRNRLRGVPPCPWCGNAYSIASCGCGKLFCCDAIGELRCPWCKKTVDLVSSDEDYDIGRGRG